MERTQATNRHRNARKARETHRFSKSWRHHEAVTCLSLYCYNFHRSVRTPMIVDAARYRVRRSPAMAARLTNHLWSMAEWLSCPAV